MAAYSGSSLQFFRATKHNFSGKPRGNNNSVAIFSCLVWVACNLVGLLPGCLSGGRAVTFLPLDGGGGGGTGAFEEEEDDDDDEEEPEEKGERAEQTTPRLPAPQSQ